ncbi:MAG: alpha/beta fold hydrolase [Candidatus Cyclobacteriaceae bacterium M3_2C_046]
MEKAYFNYQGMDIAVFQNKSREKRGILYLHGNSLDTTTFTAQFRGELSKKYKIAGFDWPGHGQSGKAAEHFYQFDHLLDLVIKITDFLDLEQVIIMGHSLGGHIGLEAAPHISNLAGLVLSGTPPLGSPPNLGAAFLPHPVIQKGYTFQPELSDAAIREMAATFVFSDSGKIDQLIPLIRNTDGRFREVLGTEIARGKLKDEVAIIENLNIPVAIFQGVHEPLINKTYLESLSIKKLWRNEIREIPAAGHSVQLENPEVFNHNMAEFAQAVWS